MAASPSPASLAELASDTGLDFPSTARVVGIERQELGEGHVRAKLVMSANEWALFSTKIPIANEAMDSGTGGFLGQDRGWWDPHAARRLRTGQVQRLPGVYLNIGVDDSDPTAVSVYILQHGT